MKYYLKVKKIRDNVNSDTIKEIKSIMVDKSLMNIYNKNIKNNNKKF